MLYALICSLFFYTYIADISNRKTNKQEIPTQDSTTLPNATGHTKPWFEEPSPTTYDTLQHLQADR